MIMDEKYYTIPRLDVPRLNHWTGLDLTLHPNVATPRLCGCFRRRHQTAREKCAEFWYKSEELVKVCLPVVCPFSRVCILQNPTKSKVVFGFVV
jgi:hypothetical protein